MATNLHRVVVVHELPVALLTVIVSFVLVSGRLVLGREGCGAAAANELEVVHIVHVLEARHVGHEVAGA